MNPQTPEQHRAFWELAVQYPYLVYLPDRDCWVGHTDALDALEHARMEELWIK